jgi:heterodisulfide reductase subunit A-like polyferredoxin
MKTPDEEDFYSKIMDLVMANIKDIDFSRDPEAVDPLIRSLTHAAAHLCLIGGVDLPSFIASCVSEAQEAASCVAKAVQNGELSLTQVLSDSLEEALNGFTTVKDPDDGLKN